MRTRFFLILLIGHWAWGAELGAITDKSILRVNSTNQAYDFIKPWNKKPPVSRRGLGTVLEGGRVLVSAELVANSNYVELEKAMTAEKCPAVVDRVDYDCNLAIVRPENTEFLKNMVPIPLDKSVHTGDEVNVLQLESNGEVIQTTGQITSCVVGGYPLENTALLLCKLRISLQQRDGSFTLPAVHDGALAGILMRYDSRNQTADLVSLPVIRRFIEEGFRGFPLMGLSFTSLRDPQFRRFIGLNEPGGIYVSDVVAHGAASKAGIQKGDVILSVAGRPLDQDGNYEDPEYGRILFSHLTNSIPLGTKIDVKIMREGSMRTIPLTMELPDRSRVVSRYFCADKAPRYVILGGLVFLELSRPYLQEWGLDWMKKAPQRLVNADAFQNELPEDRGKIIVLSDVIPTPDTIGYESLKNLIVTNMNGIPIKSLDDIVEAAKVPIKGFDKIEFEEDPKCIYLDATSINSHREALAKEYELPALERL
jgi:hypothetical protein